MFGHEIGTPSLCPAIGMRIRGIFSYAAGAVADVRGEALGGGYILILSKTLKSKIESDEKVFFIFSVHILYGNVRRYEDEMRGVGGVGIGTLQVQ